MPSSLGSPIFDFKISIFCDPNTIFERHPFLGSEITFLNPKAFLEMSLSSWLLQTQDFSGSICWSFFKFLGWICTFCMSEILTTERIVLTIEVSVYGSTFLPAIGQNLSFLFIVSSVGGHRVKTEAWPFKFNLWKWNEWLSFDFSNKNLRFPDQNWR